MRRHLACSLALAWIGATGVAHAQPAPDASPARPPAHEAIEERRAQARAQFEAGLAHYDRGEWSPALAAFLRSRDLFPTRSALRNAAVCMRKEARFDEALDLLEELQRTFPDLAPAERTFVERESAELRGLVGAIELVGAEPGAAIGIDARARGVYPPSAPLRVPSGTHIIRVYKEGYLPFERRVDVAGRQTVQVEARLAALTQGGRLVVTEVSGRALDVLVDNVVVGKTPWEGTVAPGRHTVSLRGGGEEGTPPLQAAVQKDEVTRLALAAEVLDATLRVAPTPASALVSIDGVLVGQGVWEGRLRAGAHVVEVAADGFLPQRREAHIARGERGAVPVTLDRDPSSPLWRARRPPRVFVELNGGPALGLVFGGDVRGGCAADCSAPVPIGPAITLHGGYELSSGLALGLDAGYLMMASRVTGRVAELQPRGLAPDRGTADDLLALRGFRFGPSAAYRLDTDFPVTLRLGAGAFVGSVGDGRTGTFTTAANEPFPVSVSESSRAVYVYLAPEARAGLRVWSRLEVSAGVAVLLLAALDQPTWIDRQAVLAAPPSTTSNGDGLAVFGTQTVAGAFLLAVVPSVGARYAF